MVEVAPVLNSCTKKPHTATLPVLTGLQQTLMGSRAHRPLVWPRHAWIVLTLTPGFIPATQTRAVRQLAPWCQEVGQYLLHPRVLSEGMAPGAEGYV